MKILFDQGTPAPLRRLLPKHFIVTVYENGWHELKNGDLIRIAEDEGFDLFLTTDSNLKYQQDMRNRTIAIVVLLSTSWPKIQKQSSAVITAIDSATRGSYSEVHI
ncbi:MAG: hypothetical protein AAB317_01745 [Nitrospirota bacterium]